jgi:hypothetical protein
MNAIEQLKQQMKSLKAELKVLEAKHLQTSKLNPKVLTKEEKLRAVDSLPELSDSLYELLQQDGFRTGSAEFSDCVPNDIDWCINVPPHVFVGYAVGTDTDYWIADGFTSIYAHKNGEYLNILCFSNYMLMQSWFQTTQLMQQLHGTLVSTDTFHKSMGRVCEVAFATKWKRVMVFRALKDILWPVRPLSTPLDKAEALEHYKCMICGREAINFTCMAARKEYQKTGVCERCVD